MLQHLCLVRLHLRGLRRILINLNRLRVHSAQQWPVQDSSLQARPHAMAGDDTWAARLTPMSWLKGLKGSPSWKAVSTSCRSTRSDAKGA